MNRRSRTAVDPEALKRIRASRDAEDAAIASLFRQVAAVEAAKQRRTDALAVLDGDVRNAENALAAERAALIDVAGVQRAATILAVTPSALRKLVRTSQKETVPADRSSAASAPRGAEPGTTWPERPRIVEAGRS